jgi:D-aminoacyl-tRNA deacylase
MIGLLQRVSEAEVTVDGRSIAKIGPGLLVLLGVERADTEAQAVRLAERLLAYRVFPDAAGKMNLNVNEVAGGLLLVPQFTLAADTDSGTRPSFSGSAPPDRANALFERVSRACRELGTEPALGRFGAHMQVRLINDGPVTFCLRVSAV